MKSLIICRIHISPYKFRVIISRTMRWEGHVACTRPIITSFNSLVGNAEGKRPNWKPRHRWMDNIKIVL
jgi:hypothetical protein